MVLRIAVYIALISALVWGIGEFGAPTDNAPASQPPLAPIDGSETDDARGEPEPSAEEPTPKEPAPPPEPEPEPPRNGGLLGSLVG